LVRYCISGEHFQDESSLLFRKVAFRSGGLADWLEPVREISKIEKGLYQIPDVEEVVNVSIDGFNLIIKNAYPIRSFDRDFQVERICEVVISAHDPLNIVVFSDIWNRLKKLIIFIINMNPAFDRFYLFGFAEEDDSRVELIGISPDLQETKSPQGIEVNYQLVKNDLNNIVCSWFNNKELYPVVELVLEKQRNAELWAQGYFLNVCVALETFHDKFLPKGESSRIEKRIAIAKLINDENLLDWFKKETSSWKYPTLRERLYDFKNTIEYIKGTSFQSLDIDAFLGKIVKTRNEIAHAGEHLKRFNYIELFLATRVIELTVRIEILKILGIDVENGEQHALRTRAMKTVEWIAVLNKL
jgi:hypothetical protein